jgi:hypothetical protein
MKLSRSSLLYRFLTVCSVLASAVILQWILIGGANPYDYISITAFPGFGTKRVIDVSSIPHLITHYADFQQGMVFPHWGSNAYGANDVGWSNGLVDMFHQTKAQWVEITINLYQQSPTATDVQVKPEMAPTPTALAEGIRIAHAMGYRTFVSPILSVGGKDPWAGSIKFPTARQGQAWFASYWSAIAPYVAAADQTGAEEFAIGTEYEQLQQAKAALWEQLIEKFHQNFRGKLTYNINWSSLWLTIPSWIHSPFLDAIGVSLYIPLTAKVERLAPASLPTLWRTKVKSILDTYSVHSGKPILISEIGYRNRADALYEPWLRTTKAGIDPLEQAAAYDAALRNVVGDQHIIGIFFWAWSFPLFQPNNPLACDVLSKWYTSSQKK